MFLNINYDCDKSISRLAYIEQFQQKHPGKAYKLNANSKYLQLKNIHQERSFKAKFIQPVYRRKEP